MNGEPFRLHITSPDEAEQLEEAKKLLGRFYNELAKEISSRKLERKVVGQMKVVASTASGTTHEFTIVALSARGVTECEEPAAKEVNQDKLSKVNLGTNVIVAPFDAPKSELAKFSTSDPQHRLSEEQIDAFLNRMGNQIQEFAKKLQQTQPENPVESIVEWLDKGIIGTRVKANPQQGENDTRAYAEYCVLAINHWEELKAHLREVLRDPEKVTFEAVKDIIDQVVRFKYAGDGHVARENLSLQKEKDQILGKLSDLRNRYQQRVQEITQKDEGALRQVLADVGHQKWETECLCLKQGDQLMSTIGIMATYVFRQEHSSINLLRSVARCAEDNAIACLKQTLDEKLGADDLSSLCVEWSVFKMAKGQLHTVPLCAVCEATFGPNLKDLFNSLRSGVSGGGATSASGGASTRME